MSELSKQALVVDNNQSFPNNNNGAITPSVLRAFNTNMIDSTVNQTQYTADSASFNTKITNTGSFATTGSNTFNGNQNISGSIFFPNGAEIRGTAGQQTVIASNTNLQINASSSMGINANSTIGISGSFIFIQNLRYPNFDGTAGQVLSTDGAGALAFTTVSGSGGTINTGSFATTGSNTFTGVNTFNERTNLQGINVYTGSASGIYIGDRTNFAPTTAGNIPGNQHTVVGQGALGQFGNGDLNAAFGPNTLANLVSGSSNLAMGAFAGLQLTNGNTNTFIGDQAGNGMQGGDNNFFLGSSAGNNFRTGSFNIMIGLNTQGNLATGSGNLFIGSQTGGKIANNVDNQFAVAYGTDLTPRRLLYKSGSEADNLGLYGGLEVENTFTASLQEGYVWVGNSLGKTSTVATSSFGGGGGGTAFSNPNLVSNSGSLFIVGNTFNSASANLSHISSSTQALSNIVFKNTNNTGNTIVSGSGNIFTNPSTPTTGYIRYIGGSNNIYLNSSQGAVNSEITASATSVSGNRPSMNNNIFQGTAAFTINQAVNASTAPAISNNFFGSSAGAVTINALAYTGSSFTFSDNIFKGATVTLNIASASLAEIAAGVSGSAGSGVEVIRNIMTGVGTMAITVGSKVTGGFSSFVGNIVNSTLTVTNVSSSVQVGASNNNVGQSTIYSNAGAAGLAIHRTAGTMNNNFGGMNLIASASAITGNFNVGTAAMTVTNRMFSGSLGSGSLTFTNNMNAGQGNNYIASGSYSGTGNGATMLGNAVIGSFNSIFTNVEGRGMYADFRSNVVGGQNLILTGSNNSAITASGGGYFGRFNADDGIRNQTAENIFLVGTGTSSANRKTGFLIDSGSNTFVEGTLNVSGSLTVQSGSTFFANGNKQFNVGAFQSNVTQSGSANVSQSVTFDTTDKAEGVSLVSNSQITFANAGTYSLTFSAQCDPETGAGDLYIWLKKNGTNVANSATKLSLANNAAQLMTVNFVIDAAASDYYELVWESDSGDIILLAEAASGNIPAIPSVILTAVQVR